LFELTQLQRAPRGESVPPWALGCFRRRSITYFTGAVDESTEVLWMQSRGLTADFRRPRSESKRTGARCPEELSPSEVVELARVEAGLARTEWDGRLMSWSGWVSFQTHAIWPEAGRLERVGNCLVEFAPSGAYVEDWRSEACGRGPLIGLSLLEEKELATGAVRHRGGGLIVCGRHAAFVRGRPTELPASGRLVDHVRAHSTEPAALALVFGFDGAYGATRESEDDFTVTLGTLPWREGQPVIEMEGFTYDAALDVVVQLVEEQGRRIERRFRIDTLEAHFQPCGATAVTREGSEWLEREQDSLLSAAAFSTK
jgi:hypothetical protein